MSVGHSNRPLPEFLDILRHARVGLLVDVRSFPRSRGNPAFNIGRLQQDLAQVQIGYRHIPALGGRRGRQAQVEETVNAMWRVRSFHNYADYALGEEFAAGFAELVAFGRETRVAMMCAEAVWWRCHRRIITDHLLVNGHAVDHLMGGERIDPARLTPGACRRDAGAGAGRVVYPPVA
ncbi:DUF488 family protein [Pikeienuella piscinae]|nr:DUF488 domain-containing protein [Pikeienuella piscinae]